MVAHETTEESNENHEYSRERVTNSKTRLKNFPRIVESELIEKFANCRDMKIGMEVSMI